MLRVKSTCGCGGGVRCVDTACCQIGPRSCALVITRSIASRRPLSLPRSTRESTGNTASGSALGPREHAATPQATTTATRYVRIRIAFALVQNLTWTGRKRPQVTRCEHGPVLRKADRQLERSRLAGHHEL